MCSGNMNCEAVQARLETAQQAAAGESSPGDRRWQQPCATVDSSDHSFAAAAAAANSNGGDGSSGAPPAAGVWQPLPLRSSCAYQACYCEENTWLLARSLQASHGSHFRLFAVFVSNHYRTVPLWRQRAAADPASPVVWDYHVFLLARPADGVAMVFDLDCTLEPFPCTLEQYRRHALLGADGGLPAQYHRCYRVVPAELFLAHFTSDRSHMRDASGGWLQPPPPWPCIEGGQAVAARAEAAGDGGGHSGTSVCGSNTLPAFLAFPPTEQLGRGNQQRAAPWLGSVMTEPTLLAAFGVG